MDHSGLHSGVNHLQGGDTWWFAIMGCYIGNGQASMGLKHYSVVVYHTCWNNIGILWLYCPLHDTACSHVYFLVHGQIGRSQRRKKNGAIWMAMNGWADWFDMNGCMSLVWPTMAWWHSAHGSVDWIGCLVFHRIAKRGCGNVDCSRNSLRCQWCLSFWTSSWCMFGFTVVKMVYHCALGHFESLWRSLQFTSSSAGFWSFHYGRWLVVTSWWWEFIFRSFHTRLFCLARDVMFLWNDVDVDVEI